MIRTEIAYACCALCLCSGGVIAAILYSSHVDKANEVYAMIAECETTIPRDVKCILVAQPERTIL